MKKWVALLLVMALGLFATACKPVDPVKDAAKVVAQVDDVSITKGEAQKAYLYYMNSIRNYYIVYFGQDIDLTDKTIVADLKDQTLDLMTQTVAMERELEKLGAGLTDEEKAASAAEAADRYEHALEQFVAGGNEDTAKKEMEAVGFTPEMMAYFGWVEAVSNKYRETIIKDVALTDEEIQTKYDALAAEAAEGYKTTPSNFASDVMNGATIYARPEGYRAVKNIVIGLPEEISTQIAAKNEEANKAYSDYYQQSQTGAKEDGTAITADDASKALTDALSRIQQETDALVAQGQEQVRAKAEEVLAKCKAEGADFDAIMAENSTDAVTDEWIKANGYPVAAGVTSYVQPFTDGAMALAQIGDVSELIPSNYGFHILKYAADVQPGPVPLDEVKDQVAETALTDKQNKVYDDTLVAMLKQHKISKHPDRI